MEDTSAVVVIPLERYRKLVDLETRANVLVEQIYRKKSMTVEDVLWFIGTELAIELADCMEREELNGKHEN